MSDAASIQRQYLECFNSRDWTRMRELIHPDFTYVGGDGQVMQGPDAGVAVAQMFATALPDGRINIQSQYSPGGDVAVTEFTGSGTH